MEKYIFIIIAFFCFISCDSNDEDVDKEDKYPAFIDVDNMIIAGTWYHNYTIDSIVLLFEDNTMKEYVFNKNTKELLDRSDYGKYKLEKWVYKNGNIENWIYLGNLDSLSLYSTFTYYSLSENSLFIDRGNNKIEFYKVE